MGKEELAEKVPVGEDETVEGARGRGATDDGAERG